MSAAHDERASDESWLAELDEFIRFHSPWLLEPVEFQQLAARVQEYFRAAVKRGYAAPQINDCLTLTEEIFTLRELNRKRDPQREVYYRRLEQHGRGFLKAIAALGWAETVDGVAAARAIENFLGSPDENPEEARIIAGKAQVAWAAANNGKFPRSADPNAPLCKIVNAVLGEAGIHLSPAAVSAVLQGKRRQR